MGQPQQHQQWVDGSVRADLRADTSNRCQNRTKEYTVLASLAGPASPGGLAGVRIARENTRCSLRSPARLRRALWLVSKSLGRLGWRQNRSKKNPKKFTNRVP